MSTIELRSEVIRLVNGMDERLMEDLLSSIKVFIGQQEDYNDTDTSDPKILTSLNKALNEVTKSELLSNEEILSDTAKWLSK